MFWGPREEGESELLSHSKIQKRGTRFAVFMQLSSKGKRKEGVGRKRPGEQEGEQGRDREDACLCPPQVRRGWLPVCERGRELRQPHPECRLVQV